MAIKGPSHTDEAQIFATHASHDIQFPKHTDDYDEVSSYLELNVDYLPLWIFLIVFGNSMWRIINKRVEWKLLSFYTRG